MYTYTYTYIHIYIYIYIYIYTRAYWCRYLVLEADRGLADHRLPGRELAGAREQPHPHWLPRRDGEGGGGEGWEERRREADGVVCPDLLGKVDVRLPGKLPWREAGPPNHHDDKVDSDQ